MAGQYLVNEYYNYTFFGTFLKMKADLLLERSIPLMFLSLKLQLSRFWNSSCFTWCRTHRLNTSSLFYLYSPLLSFVVNPCYAFNF
jgi:hypothetical protein